jgi:hypothetical protein
MPRTKKIGLPPTLAIPATPPKTWLQEQLADKGLWHSIVGAFIGGFMAIFAGLAVYSFQTMNQHAQELRVKNEQKRIILEGLKRALEDNIKTMNAYLDPRNPSIIVNNLNLTYFESTSQIKYQILGNDKLSEEIDDLSFRLNSLEEETKNYQSIYFNPLTAANQRFINTTARDLRLNISLGTKQTGEIAILVLKDVNTELENLDNISGPTPNP